MAYKQQPGRGPMMKTGGGVPSALLQTKPTDPVTKKKTDEKTGSKSLPATYKGINFEQDPNLSESEDALVSQRIVNRGTWKKDLAKASPETFDAKWGLARKAQRAKDSSTIVNSRVHRFGPGSAGSSQGTNLAKVTDADKKDLKRSFEKYVPNTFARNKEGDVRVNTNHRLAQKNKDISYWGH